MEASKVRVLVLRTAGINCDAETVAAWEQVGTKVELKHFNEIAGSGAAAKLARYQILTIPGGFAYGDDLGAGKLLAIDLLYRLKDTFTKFVDSGKPVLGICNGFQVLAKAGLFGDMTITHNEAEKFECRWVYLKTSPDSNCIFTRGIERLYLPIAHGEGRVMVKNEATLTEMDSHNQLALRYVDEYGNLAGYPANPNGSVANVAGVSNKTGTVFGLMPHPERFISPLLHPRWTRMQGTEGEIREGDGLKIFQNALEFVANGQ